MARLVLDKDKTDQFKGIFKLIGGLVTEIQITLTQEALIIRATDIANVCMALLDLEKNFFKEFDVEKPVKFGIGLDELNTVLGRFNEEIELEAAERLIIRGKENMEKDKTFQLSMIDITEEQHKRPELEYPGEITMKSEAFANSIEDISVVTEDSTSFIIENKKFKMEAGGNKSDARIDFGEDIKVHIPENIIAKYSIEYLSKISAKITEDVHIKIKKDFPLTLDYKGEDFMLTFILAPRVENE